MRSLLDYPTRRRSSPLVDAVRAYKNPAGSLGGTGAGSGRMTTSLSSGAGAGGQNSGLSLASGQPATSPSSAPDFQSLLSLVNQVRAAKAQAAQAPSSSSASSSSPQTLESPSGVTYEIHGPVTATVRAAIKLAESFVGTPYVWGGSKPGGFDCSGLLYYAWGREGVSIPRTTYGQIKAGRAVSTSALRPGDAVFYHGGSHVAMYIGGGRMLESPHTGAKVRIVPLRSGIYAARRFAR
jgi:cell wall-associated NlpC family hydrolase